MESTPSNVSKPRIRFNPISVGSEETIKTNPVDLDLMLFQVTKKSKTSGLIRRMILYLPFVIFVTVYMFFGYEIQTGFWMQRGIRSQFLEDDWPQNSTNTPDGPITTPWGLKLSKSFIAQEINNQEDYYRWLRGLVIPNLFIEQDNNGDSLKPNYKGYNQMHNKNIGALRIRTHRVRTDACPKAQRFFPKTKNFDQVCYAELDSSTEDKTSFGPNGIWKWGDCAQIRGGNTYSGRKFSLPCSGFAVFIPLNSTNADADSAIEFLQKNGWIDKKTKSQMVEWYTYNNNLNYFTSVKFVVEFTRGGGQISTWEIESFRLQPFRNSSNIVYFVFSMLSPIFLAISFFTFLLDFWYEIRYGRWWHYWIDSEFRFPFLNIWNWFEILNFLLIVISYIIRLHIANLVRTSKFDIIALGPNYPGGLETISYWTIQDMNVISFCLIVSYFKLFKFFELNDHLNLLSITLQKSAANLGSVIITILLSLCAFSMTGWMIFGYDLDDFKDFSSAFSALLRIMIGENKGFDEYQTQARTAWLIFYIIFMCTNFLICINMVFAVIEGNFTSSIPDVLNKSVGFDFDGTYQRGREFVRKSLFIDRGIRPISSKNIEINQGDDELIEKLKLFQIQHKKNEITADDLRVALKGAGEETITRIMARYDYDNDGTIQLVELERLSNKRKHLHATDAPIIIKKKSQEKSNGAYIASVSEKLEFLEHVLQ